MLGVAIGVAVMLLSLAVVLGFKHEVSSKVIGFGSHIQVLSLTQNQNYEMMPVLTNDTLIRKVKKVQGVGRIQKFATKIGILKTEEDFRGLTFKGVGEDYDLSFFQSCLKDGKMLLLRGKGRRQSLRSREGRKRLVRQGKCSLPQGEFL